MKDFKGGFLTLLGFLLAMIIISFLAYIVLNTYFKESPVDKRTRESLSEQGIDASSRQSILNSTRKTIQDIKRKSRERLE